MASQLTIRFNAEDGIAVVSRSTPAGNGGITIQNDSAREALARSRVLAVAAAAGSQVLAVTAAAQDEVGGQSTYTPILVPEQVVVIALAAAIGGLVGAAGGVIVTRRSGGKKKDDE